MTSNPLREALEILDLYKVADHEGLRLRSRKFDFPLRVGDLRALAAADPTPAAPEAQATRESTEALEMVAALEDLLAKHQTVESEVQLLAHARALTAQAYPMINLLRSLVTEITQLKVPTRPAAPLLDRLEAAEGALREIAGLADPSRPETMTDDFDRGARAARLEAAEIAHAHAFALAAGVCEHRSGDERGHPLCLATGKLIEEMKP